MFAMHLYHISYNDLGNRVNLEPKIPKYQIPGEEHFTARVCAAPTVLQCLYSKNSYYDEDLWVDGIRRIYIYEAMIPVTSIYQPSVTEVEDTWFTSEFWVTNTYSWTKLGAFDLKLGEKVMAKDHNYRYYLSPTDKTIIGKETKKFALDGVQHDFYFTEVGPSNTWLNMINETLFNEMRKESKYGK